jgi:hypothetical protein
MSVKRVALAVILGLVIFVTGCANGSFITIKSHENNTSTAMSMSYEKFSGFKSRTIKLDEPGKINVDILSESGSLNLAITDKDGNSYYDGADIPTSSFSVNLDKPGEYEFKVEADNHKGSYNISWDTPND